MNSLAGYERSQHIARLYVMTKAVAMDGLARGFPVGSVRSAVALYCYCARGGLNIFEAHEVLQTALFMASRQRGSDTQ